MAVLAKLEGGQQRQMLSTAHKYGKWKVRETPAE